MAAWPNAALTCDCVWPSTLSSVEAGATIIGKGLMKAPMQAVFFVALFRKSTANAVLGSKFFVALQDALNAAVQALKPGAPEVNFAQIANAKREKMFEVDNAQHRQVPATSILERWRA